MESGYKLITHRFNTWDEIPNIEHLEKIPNSYVRAFNNNDDTIVFISYIVDEKGIVLAFGSGTYFSKDNYYGDDDFSDYNAYGDYKIRQLWIEGLVSTKKGLGRIILSELERELISLAKDLELPYKVINVMSINESLGFFESCGYVEGTTSPRFYGTGNNRCVKAFENNTLDNFNIINYNGIYEEYLYIFLLYNRRKMIDECLNIPKNIKTDFLAYFLNNIQSKYLFKNNIDREKAIKEVLDYVY